MMPNAVTELSTTRAAGHGEAPARAALVPGAQVEFERGQRHEGAAEPPCHEERFHQLAVEHGYGEDADAEEPLAVGH